MFYYNQTDYANIKYDNKSTAAVETIATSGCGPCAACIAVNSLANKELFTVKEMAQLSLNSGARDNSGTNMTTLLKAICKKHGDFSFSTTNDESKVVSHIKGGGIVIANQGDAYNIFSTAGHFVVLDSLDGGNINVLDPQMYSGKYDSYKRPQRIVKKTSYGCVVTSTELGKATADRNPAYFMLSYAKAAVKTEAKTKTAVRFDAGSTYVLTTNVNVRGGAGTSYAIKKVKDLTADGKKNCTSTNSNANATLKSGTKVTALKVIKSGNDVWLQIPSGYIAVYYNGDKYANWAGK